MAKKQSNKTLVFFLVLVFTVFVVVSVFAPKPVDWTSSYSQRHGRPLGERLVYSVLPDLFPRQNLVTMHTRLDDFLEETTPINTNFIYISDLFSPDSVETEKLFEVVEAGNMVFIAAERLAPDLMSRLNLQIQHSGALDPSVPRDSIQFNFANRRLNIAMGYWFKKAISNHYFTSYDTLRSTVLGYNQEGKTNFIRIKMGAGFIYLNSNPLAFTNYHLLSGNNSEYIFKCLSYLPVSSTVWDEHHKPGKAGVGSELGYILRNPSLRIAWYLLLIGVLVYFIFKGKRRQRPIPVEAPPRNNTLDFVETVGRLYFVNQDHKGIAQKRFVYFLDFLRTRYFVDTSKRDSQLIEEVAKKSGIPERTVAALFKVAGNLEKVRLISQEDLQQFNRQIEYFYKNCR